MSLRAALILDGTHPNHEGQLQEAADFFATNLSGAQIELWLFGARSEELAKDAHTPLSLPQSLIITALWALPSPEPMMAETLLPVLAEAYRTNPQTLLLFASDTLGGQLATRLSERLQGTALTQVLALTIEAEHLLARRHCYCQTMIATLELSHRPFCCAIAKRSYTRQATVPFRGAVKKSPEGFAPPRADTPCLPGFLKEICPVGTAPQNTLASARRVLALGLGVQSAQALSHLQKMAEENGFALGISRAVAMKAWGAFSALLGISGEIIAADLCLVAGASGTAAFTAGIAKSTCIVAVNTDPDAAIFKIAHIGIVCDLHVFLPTLFQAMATRKGASDALMDGAFLPEDPATDTSS